MLGEARDGRRSEKDGKESEGSDDERHAGRKHQHEEGRNAEFQDDHDCTRNRALPCH